MIGTVLAHPALPSEFTDAEIESLEAEYKQTIKQECGRGERDRSDREQDDAQMKYDVRGKNK